MVAGVPLARIQQRAFAVLGALVDFFQAHAIDYYLVGGTLLGAVRHGGFIPWDDDIDIVVPRKDYRRLLGLLDRLPPTLRAIHPSIDAHTPYPFLVVSDRHSRWVVDYAHPFDRGIGVDVFPLDGVPPPGMRRRLLRKSIALLRSMTMNKQKGYYLRPVPRPSAGASRWWRWRRAWCPVPCFSPCMTGWCLRCRPPAMAWWGISMVCMATARWCLRKCSARAPRSYSRGAASTRLNRPRPTSPASTATSGNCPHWNGATPAIA